MEALAGSDAFFARLSREPDFTAPELHAHDAADELLLATAGPEIARLGSGELVVIGDRHGALTLGAAALLGATGVRTHQDPLLGERALHANAARLELGAVFASHPLGRTILSDARVVLVQLPRGLDALDEIAWSIARYASPEVRVYAGGRVKHMTRAMNEVLGKYFDEVSAGLGWRKSRVLTANASRDPGPSPVPRWGRDPALPFQLAAYGATFGGPTLDHGSRLLLADLETAAPSATRIVDLGCGNGVLAVAAALARPGAHVIATDQSAAAVAAARATVVAAGVAVPSAGAALDTGVAPDSGVALDAGAVLDVAGGSAPGARIAGTERSASGGHACAHDAAALAPGVCVHRADALEAVPDGWAELILLNPPFHTGATVHAGVAHRLIRATARALAPGGELRIVFNSHLQYRPLIESVIGPCRQVSRDRTFTVLAATRR